MVVIEGMVGEAGGVTGDGDIGHGSTVCGGGNCHGSTVCGGGIGHGSTVCTSPTGINIE